jgi:hypothetical protein
MKWWINSLPLFKPYENKILKYPNPLHTFSNDSNDNNIPSQIKNHHYLIKTLPHFDTAPSHQRKLISKHHQLQTDKIVFQANSTLIVNEL